jgi:osmotically-inducible protein OsmY
MRSNKKLGIGIAKNVALAAILLAGVGVGAPRATAEAPRVQAADSQDAQIQKDLADILKGKRFRGITAQVTNGAVTLSGTVANYEDKADAEKKAHKVPNIASIQNNIEVSGPAVPDGELGQKLAGKLSTDGLNPSLTQYEYFSVSVQNGVVTLNGFALDPAHKDWATGTVETTPGVKGLINNVQVAPPSPNDDRIRRAVATAIYGYPIFTKYAINPNKPIRILVLNGNVTLAGAVDTKSDSDVAALRANGVNGAFKVTNNLQVAGQEH